MGLGQGDFGSRYRVAIAVSVCAHAVTMVFDMVLRCITVLSMAYTKLFSEIVASSVWDEDDKTRLVWITMLALKNRDHFVRGTERFICLAARVSPEDCRHALDKLEGPDPQSRTPANEGRRVAAVPGGWQILNGDLYQHKLSPAERAEYNRGKQAEYRARQKAKRPSKTAARVRAEYDSREKRYLEADKAGDATACDRIAAEGLPAGPQAGADGEG